MKRKILLGCFVLAFFVGKAQVERTVNIIAGGLSSAIPVSERNTITDLIVVGQLDARDFRIMRDSMNLLARIDLSGAEIVSYTGNKGTEDQYPYGTSDFFYPGNVIPQYAFFNKIANKSKKTLIELKLPPALNSIRKSAFSGCSGLVGIDFNEGLKIIEESAFYGCTALTGIQLPSTLEVLGSSVFEACRKIIEISIPASVYVIGQDALAGVQSGIEVSSANLFYSSEDGVLLNKEKTVLIQFPLARTGEYQMPASVTKIISGAFTGAILSSVVFSDALDSIGDGAFWGCGKLAIVNLPSGVRYIGPNAFANMTSLKTFVLPPLVTTITSNMLGMNDNLATVLLSESVQTIESLAFQNCPSLKFLSFPKSVKFISRDAFNENTAIKAFYFSGSTPPSVADSSYMTDGFVKSKCTLYVQPGSMASYQAAYWWKSFSKIVEESFNPVITAVAGQLGSAIPVSLRPTLESLVVKGTIDARDFRFLRDSLPAVSTLDLQLAQIIGYIGTAGTQPGKNLSYPANGIPVYAFCDSLKTSLSKTNLKSIVFPSTTASIGKKSFMNCDGLSSVWFPPSVKTIGESAFESCDQLGYAFFSDGLETIEKNAFYWCEVLQTIQLPNTVTSIGEMAFYLCDDAVSLILSTALKVLPRSVFGACRQIKTVVLPPMLEEIGNSAFASCSRLTAIDIPGSVTTIGSSAFSFCDALTRADIPASVNNIGTMAFFYCKALAEIHVASPVPVDLSASASVFKSVNTSTCKLYIPYGSKAAYSEADQWKDFMMVEGTAGFTLSQTTLVVGEEGGAFDSVRVESTMPWTISCDQPWVTVSPGSGNGTDSLQIVVETNLTYTERSAALTITFGSGAVAGIEVRQAAASVKQLTVSAVALELEGSQSQTTLFVNANTTWKAVPDQSWLSVSPDSVVKGNKTLIVQAVANPTLDQRSGRVVISGTGVDTINLEVTQAAGLPALSVPLSQLVLSCSDGSSATVKVTSNTIWQAVSEQTWLTVTPGTGTGNGQITLTAVANVEHDPRSATVNLTAEGVSPIKILVSQEASPFLTVDAFNVVLSYHQNSSDTVVVSSNLIWQATPDQNWLRISPPNGFGNHELIVTADENTLLEGRSAEVILSGDGVSDQIIRVVQEPADTLLEVPEQTLPLGYAEGSSCQVDIRSNTTWQITDLPAWLSISSSEGTGSYTLTIVAQANTGYESRHACIRFETSGTLSDSLVLIQDPAPYLWINSDTLEVGKEGTETLSLVMAANVGWQVTADQSWISLSQARGERSDTVLVSVQANQTVLSRQGLIRFSGDKVETKTVSVIQAAGDTVFVVTPADTILAVQEGSSTTIGINANVNWRISIDQPWLSVDRSEGKGSGEIKLIAAENSQPETRSARVTISSATRQFVVVLTQNANKIMEVSSHIVSVAQGEGSTASLVVTSNVGWSVSIDSDWLHVTPSSGTGNAVVVFTAKANPLATERQTTVVLSSAEATPVSVEVVQTPAQPYITLSQTLISMKGEEGSTVQIKLTSNTKWSAFTEQDWLSIEPDSGFGDTTIRLTGKLNTTKMDRPAIVVFSAQGVESKILNLVQVSGNSGKDDLTTTQVSLFPNPVNEGFWLRGISGPAELSVSSSDGKEWIRLSIASNGFVNTSDLQSGIYLVRIQFLNQVVIKKITKN